MTADVRPIPHELLERAAALGAPLDQGAADKLALYLARLLEVNEVMNVTAVTGWDVALERHLLDSLSLVAPLRAAGVRRVVDVGSGGGLPGIPLAIALGDVEVSLVESTKKKAAFLGRVASELSLPVTVLAERAETLCAKAAPERERYDAVVARALAPLPVLLELISPFVKVGGLVLAIKGERAPEELAAAARAMAILHLEHLGAERTSTGTVVSFRKTAATPGAYPRAPGMPKQSPL